MQGFANDINRFLEIAKKEDLKSKKNNKKKKLTQTKDSETNNWSFMFFKVKQVVLDLQLQK